MPAASMPVAGGSTIPSPPSAPVAVTVDAEELGDEWEDWGSCGIHDEGDYPVEWDDADLAGFAETADVVGADLDVEIADAPPVFDPIDPQTATWGRALRFWIFATDPEEGWVTYDVGALPRGATFDAGSGDFSWRPLPTDPERVTVTFIATDPAGNTATITVPIEVRRPLA